MGQEGFTLVELIIIVIILGILAVSAVPIYTSLSGDAKTSAEKDIVGKVRMGIALYFVNTAKNGETPSYPPSLETETVPAGFGTDPPLFTQVIQGGVDEEWEKLAPERYRGPTGTIYVYNSSNGTFLKE